MFSVHINTITLSKYIKNSIKLKCTMLLNFISPPLSKRHWMVSSVQTFEISRANKICCFKLLYSLMLVKYYKVLLWIASVVLIPKEQDLISPQNCRSLLLSGWSPQVDQHIHNALHQGLPMESKGRGKTYVSVSSSLISV